MAQIEIQGVRYPWPEEDDLTWKEMAFIQSLCGGLPMDGNINVVIGTAYVALQRAGREPDLDKLYSLKIGDIKKIADEVAASPLAEAPAATEPEQNGLSPAPLRHTPVPSGPQG